MPMADLAGAIFFILFGLFFLVFHSTLSSFAVNRWHKRFPGIKVWRKCYDVPFLIMGVVFIIFGVLMVLR